MILCTRAHTHARVHAHMRSHVAWHPAGLKKRQKDTVSQARFFPTAMSIEVGGVGESLPSPNTRLQPSILQREE